MPSCHPQVQKVANKKSSEPQGLAALLGGLGGMGAKIPPVAYLATNLAQAHPPKVRGGSGQWG